MAVIVKELLARYKGDTRGLEAATKRANKAMDTVNRSTKKAARAQGGFQDALGKSVFTIKNLIGVTLAFKAIGLADEFTLIQGRLRNVTRSTEEFTQAFEGLKQISRETGSDLSALVSIFQRISFVRDEIDATTESMLQFTDTVSKLGIISGASTGALRSGLTQLGQSLSSSIVRAEEFNSIMENIPAVGVAIADALGVNTAELRKLVIEGKLLSEDVFVAILSQSEKVRQEFEKFPVTVGRAFANLKLRMQEAIDSINEGTNATKGLIFAMELAGKAVIVIGSIVKTLGTVIKAFFNLVAVAISEGFELGAKNIEDAINFAIRGLNKLRKEGNKIEPIDFGLVDIDGRKLAEIALLEAGLDMEKATREAEQVFKDIKALFKKGGKSGESARIESEALDELIAKYQELLAAIKNAADIKAADKAFKKLRKETQAFSKALAEVKKETEAMRNELADFFIDGMAGFDDLRDSALKAIQAIARNMLRITLGGKAEGGIAGKLAELAVGLFTGGGDFQLGDVPARKPAPPPIKAAHGTSFMVGGVGGTDSQLVSIRATPNERITVERPGQNLRGGGGGESIVINQNINVSMGIQQTVRAELLRFLPQIQSTTTRAVEDARARGKV